MVMLHLNMIRPEDRNIVVHIQFDERGRVTYLQSGASIWSQFSLARSANLPEGLYLILCYLYEHNHRWHSREEYAHFVTAKVGDSTKAQSQTMFTVLEQFSQRHCGDYENGTRFLILHCLKCFK